MDTQSTDQPMFRLEWESTFVESHEATVDLDTMATMLGYTPADVLAYVASGQPIGNIGDTSSRSLANGVSEVEDDGTECGIDGPDREVTGVRLATDTERAEWLADAAADDDDAVQAVIDQADAAH